MPASAWGILREAALDYREFPTVGKTAIAPTRQMINPRDLATSGRRIKG